MGEGVPLSHALPPLPLVVKVMGKTFRYVQLQPPHFSALDQFFYLFILICLFAL
jgi:hypothetical protein